MEQMGVGNGPEDRYYNKLNRATDFILRCKDCKALVLIEEIRKVGSCACGNKRFAEIITLNSAEMERLASLDFPYKAEFLAEFSPV